MPEEIDSGRIVTAQALSGTGSLQIIAQFMVEFLKVKKIHIPNPTWVFFEIFLNLLPILEIGYIANGKTKIAINANLTS